MAQSPTLTTLHNFTGSDGSFPEASMVVGPDGTLYGTTNGLDQGVGTVFSMTPPASPGGAWAFNVLHTFASGEAPLSNVVIGSGGTLYGTTPYGGGGSCIEGGCGTAFSLAPPASPGGEWTYTVLWSFSAGADGANPSGALAIGAGGVLYGTTQGTETTGPGTVFALLPPASAGGAWTKRLLYTFSGSNDGIDPIAGVVIGPGGVLYGTTYVGGFDNNGTVFSLTPSGDPIEPWTETQIHAFGEATDGAFPGAPLLIGAGGVLYGTTISGGTAFSGTVFSVTPPASPGGEWGEAIIHSFAGTAGHDGANPRSGLAIGPHGFLYGTTVTGGRPDSDGGIVFAMIPPSAGGSWTEQILYVFPTFGDPAPSGPFGGVVGSGGVLYGTASGGTSNLGAVFSLE
ncbi:MAG: choice-of-anchor tandem repeat GloVer-containing protein [Bryobacteraceae bacterium]|jgi:hypothetical protein